MSYLGWCLQLLLEIVRQATKAVCRIVGPSLAAFLELLAHRRNVASLSIFYGYYFGRCSSELAQLVPRPFSRGRSTRYSDRLHDFSVTIPRCSKDVYVNNYYTEVKIIRNLAMEYLLFAQFFQLLVHLLTI